MRLPHICQPVPPRQRFLAKSARIGRLGLINPEADAPIPASPAHLRITPVMPVAWRAQSLYRRGIFR
ncbi:hypothetical protein V1286_000402 [Bradyrhizobium algeriense]|uniref:Uncharacterized protein n=1 Tax=Bradyrhizobium algeriense TaxID=634784 RepID=A0ABU8B2V1_9BRAD